MDVDLDTITLQVYNIDKRYKKLNDSDKIVKIKGFRDNVSLINFMLTEKCPFRATVLKSKYVTFVLFLNQNIFKNCCFFLSRGSYAGKFMFSFWAQNVNKDISASFYSILTLIGYCFQELFKIIEICVQR